jgi:hypothetical protein
MEKDSLIAKATAIRSKSTKNMKFFMGGGKWGAHKT